MADVSLASMDARNCSNAVPGSFPFSEPPLGSHDEEYRPHFTDPSKDRARLLSTMPVCLAFGLAPELMPLVLRRCLRSPCRITAQRASARASSNEVSCWNRPCCGKMCTCLPLLKAFENSEREVLMQALQFPTCPIVTDANGRGSYPIEVASRLSLEEASICSHACFA